MECMTTKLRFNLHIGIVLVFTLMILLFSPFQSKAQLGDFGDMLLGGIDDGEKLASEFLQPFGSGFGADINTGWVNNASTHSTLGFSLNIKVSGALSPTAARTYDVNNVDLNRMRLADPNGESITQTVSGSTDDGPMMEAVVGEDETVVSSFPMPEGLGLRVIPAAMIQGNVGIGLDTELMIRYFPPVINVDDMFVGLMGAGLKHEINQHIPGGDLWPVTITLMGGYTNLTATFDEFTMEPEDYNRVSPHNTEDFPASTWEGQELTFTNNSWNANILVGHDLPAVSFYGGFGIEGSDMEILAEGNYPFIEPDPTPEEPERTRLASQADPIDLSIDGTNEFRAILGTQLRFGMGYFSLEYTYSDYQAINGGFGVTFR